MKICNFCGAKADNNYSFCPHCGKKLSENIPPPEFSSGQTGTNDHLVCDNCGWDNNPSNTVCESCGVPLSEGTTPKAKSYDPQPKNTKEPDRKRSKQTEQKVISSPPQEKSLTRGNLLAIIIIFVLLAFLVILFSGVLESPKSGTGTPASGLSSGNQQLDPSIAELENHLRHDPDDQNSRLQLANLQSDARLYQQAIQNYEIYLSANPKDADARIDMGISYYNLKNYPKAVEEMERALNYSPKHQIGHLNLGIVNLTAGNLEASRNWLKKAVDLDPGSEAGRRAKELLDSH
jgi:ribosomal protein L37E